MLISGDLMPCRPAANIDFQYSRKRLKVAISRALPLLIFASPLLLETACTWSNCGW